MDIERFAEVKRNQEQQPPEKGLAPLQKQQNHPRGAVV